MSIIDQGSDMVVSSAGGVLYPGHVVGVKSCVYTCL